MGKEKSCGALVYSKQGDKTRFLLIKHKQGGHWSFPKGHVEKNETEHQTALREVKEETGVSIQILAGFREQVNYSPRPGISKDVVYFLGFASNTHTKRQESEISELAWVNLETLPEFLTYDNDRMLFSRAREYILRNAHNMPGNPSA